MEKPVEKRTRFVYKPEHNDIILRVHEEHPGLSQGALAQLFWQALGRPGRSTLDPYTLSNRYKDIKKAQAQGQQAPSAMQPGPNAGPTGMHATTASPAPAYTSTNEPGTSMAKTAACVDAVAADTAQVQDQPASSSTHKRPKLMSPLDVLASAAATAAETTVPLPGRCPVDGVLDMDSFVESHEVAAGGFGTVIAAYTTGRGSIGAGLTVCLKHVQLLGPPEKLERTVVSSMRELSLLRLLAQRNDSNPCIRMLGTFMLGDEMVQSAQGPWPRHHALVLEQAACTLLQRAEVVRQGSEHEWRGCKLLPLALLQDIARQLLNCIAYLHILGWVHRDIKPQNVLVMPGTALVLKLCDFGCAKDFVSEQSALWGTRPYHPGALKGCSSKEQLDHELEALTPHMLDLVAAAVTLITVYSGTRNPLWEWKGDAAPQLPEWVWNDVEHSSSEPHKQLQSLLLGMLGWGPLRNAVTAEGLLKHPFFMLNLS